jgi:hypothetical protein
MPAKRDPITITHLEYEAKSKYIGSKVTVEARTARGDIATAILLLDGLDWNIRLSLKPVTTIVGLEVWEANILYFGDLNATRKGLRTEFNVNAPAWIKKHKPALKNFFIAVLHLIQDGTANTKLAQCGYQLSPNERQSIISRLSAHSVLSTSKVLGISLNQLPTQFLTKIIVELL